MASPYTKTQSMDLKKDKDNRLRQPVAVIKKRSGPLDGIIDELNRSEEAAKSNSKQTEKPSVPGTQSYESTKLSTSTSGRRRFQNKDKEKKRERWLLTRKTWRYMTDAGRKLLPEGKLHGTDSITQIEAEFQRVCASEPRFILWRRKSSFPGATKSSRKRLRIVSHHRSNYSAQSLHKNQELNECVDVTIELLQSYLKIRDSYKTTALLGSKTVRPDQTSSPSSQRPIYDKAFSNCNEPILNTHYETTILERLKILQNSSLGGLQLGLITSAILEDKALLKKIYNILKKQQLHRILHSTEPIKTTNLDRSTSFSSLYSNSCENDPIEISNFKINGETKKPIVNRQLHKMVAKRLPPKTLELSASTKSLEANILQNRSNRIHELREKSVNSCGSQTNFVPLSELKCMAEQYEQLLENNYNTSDTEDIERSPPVINANHKRSSIDNEDVSQSVSDTIKRYLRMARKKSIHDGDASRFRSVNYDRNLKNIKAKGEINPPGMDDGNNKAVQTLDAWALIALDFIRGNENSKNLENAHIAWKKQLDERIRKKNDWDKQFTERKNKESVLLSRKENQSSCLSAPTSPTSPSHHLKEKTGRTASAILTSSSHFLSNFWHPTCNEPSSTQSLKYGNPNEILINSKNETTNMQKSKSLSNVGQFVSRKIWGSRSKCQNRQNQSQDFVQQRQKWAPLETGSWVSEDGQVLQLTDTSLVKLSAIESECLVQIALEKIKELNIGLNINLERKSQKNRVILKKRALTTSFFDIGKKDEHNGRDNLFGTSLEYCLSRDKKRGGEIESGSKHSLTSVFRSGRVGKLNDNVRSYESLPTKSLDYERCIPSNNVGSSDYLTNLQKSSSVSMEMSRSQFDMRNVELDIDRVLFDVLKNSCTLKVPLFLTICIEYLEEHGLQKVGLFRVSTSQKRVKQLREEFDKNCNMRIPDKTCPHDVATLLKEFLRDLPEPLLTKRLYSTFLETQRIRNRRLQLEAISHLIKLLPIEHRDTLFVLLKFLGNVASHSDDVCSRDGTVHMIGNKMDSNNLSTVFAPNILRDNVPKAAEYREQGNMGDAINVIRIMIDHYEEIFKVPVELVDVLYTHMFDTCPEQLHAVISSKINQSATSQIDRTKSNETQVLIRDGAYNLEPLTDGRRQSTPIILENQSVFSASLQIAKPDESSSKPAKATQMQESKVHITSISEPKLPTSISNIGGATLIAKTAEFEKNSSKGTIRTPKAKTLYKRQQLIPSSKR